MLLAEVVNQLLAHHDETNARAEQATGVPNPGLGVVIVAACPCDVHPRHFVLGGDVEGPELEALLVDALRAVRSGRTLSVGQA